MTAQPEPAESLDRCISVRVAGALYGLRVEEVQEVIGTRPITRVFHAPAALAGVTSLRGDVLPVLDLGVLLGGDGGLASTPEVRIVVVREKAGRAGAPACASTPWAACAICRRRASRRCPPPPRSGCAISPSV